MLACQISSQSVYSVALWGKKKPQFLPFLDYNILWCRQLAAIWESSTRMHNYKPSPIQRHLNRFCTPAPSWRNWAHKLWCSKAWRTDRQINKQMTQRFWPPWRHVKFEPHQTWHSHRGPQVCSCTSKNFWGPTHSFAARGNSKFGGNETPELKTLITP